jgi:NAD(P)-dependent dehydrogenase (short-subunit alcohol dehydrogenase family)
MTTISLVTGGSRGLGRNTALSIARRGGDVILTYHQGANNAQAVVAEIEAMGRRAAAIQLDTSSIIGFPEFVQRVSALLRSTWQRQSFDHLINNAGHGEMAAFNDTTEAQFDQLFNVHVKGVFFLTQALLPLLKDGGKIVNLSTGLTRVSYPGFSAYAAAKGAVEILTIYLAKELGARGITANTIAPGATATDFLGGAVRDTPAYNEAFAALIALGRVGLPGDIGPAVASLLSPDNNWITAQRVEVSGGQNI